VRCLASGPRTQGIRLLPGAGWSGRFPRCRSARSGRRRHVGGPSRTARRPGASWQNSASHRLCALSPAHRRYRSVASDTPPSGKSCLRRPAGAVDAVMRSTSRRDSLNPRTVPRRYGVLLKEFGGDSPSCLLVLGRDYGASVTEYLSGMRSQPPDCLSWLHRSIRLTAEKAAWLVLAISHSGSAVEALADYHLTGCDAVRTGTACHISRQVTAILEPFL
jgi:hypothetical protein